MPQYTVLACPSCGGKTSLQSGTPSAICDYCGSQLILRPSEGVGLTYAGPALERGIVSMPKDVRVENLPDGLLITRRWFSIKYIPMAFFSLFWDGFLVFWYSVAFAGGAPLMMKLFPLLHVAAGFIVTYSTLTGFLNTTSIRVTRKEFSVQHKPLPWFGQTTLPSYNLEQLYCRVKVSHGKNGTTTTYTVSAVLHDGRTVDLVKDLDLPETAFYIERQVESYLMIQDQPVAGEMARA